MIEIGGFQKQSLIDFPGRISSVVFLQGCNLNCVFCHNRHLIPMKNGVIPHTTVLDYLRKAKRFIEGVVISGGEPTLQHGVIKFAKALKELGYSIKLDTNGTCPHVIDCLVRKKLVDFVAMDIKAPLDPVKYSAVCGCRAGTDMIKKIRKSIEIITNCDVQHEFRTTFIQGLLSEKDIIEIAHSLPETSHYVLQQFVPSSYHRRTEMLRHSTDTELLFNLREKCKNILQNVSVRTYL